MLARMPVDPLAQLRAENEDLREENALLRRQMRLEKDLDAESALAIRWSLTGKEARILHTLYLAQGRVLSKGAVMDALYAGDADEPELKIIDVFICKLRKKVGGGAVNTVWGRGYAMTAEGMALCADAIAAAPQEVFMPEPPRVPSKERPGKVTRVAAGLRVLHKLTEAPATVRALAAALQMKSGNVYSALRWHQALGHVEVVDLVRLRGGRPAGIYALTGKGLLFMVREDAAHVEA